MWTKIPKIPNNNPHITIRIFPPFKEPIEIIIELTINTKIANIYFSPRDLKLTVTILPSLQVTESQSKLKGPPKFSQTL